MKAPKHTSYFYLIWQANVSHSSLISSGIPVNCDTSPLLSSQSELTPTHREITHLFKESNYPNVYMVHVGISPCNISAQ